MSNDNHEPVDFAAMFAAAAGLKELPPAPRPRWWHNVPGVMDVIYSTPGGHRRRGKVIVPVAKGGDDDGE